MRASPAPSNMEKNARSSTAQCVADHYIEESYSPTNMNNDEDSLIDEQRGSDSDDQSDCERQAETMMDQIEVQDILDLACEIRQSQHPGLQKSMTCKLISSSDYGSFNLVYRLEFHDGVRWILKIPLNGHLDKWGEEQAHHMTYVVDLMRWMKNNTSIPVAQVHAFSNNHQNPLGVPYIFEDMMPGITLQQARMDSSVSEEEMNRRRAQAIHDVAKYMVELSQVKFGKIGAPELHAGGFTGNVGPFFRTSLESDGPFDDLGSLICDELTRTRALPVDVYNVCIRIFLDWIEKFAGDDGEFSLFHPDLHTKNILSDEQTGRVTGIIDWDFTRTLPKALGIHSFPLFISGDWKGAELADSDPEEPCLEGLNCSILEGQTSPCTVDAQDWCHHETADYLRAIWRKCILNFTEQLDRTGRLVDMDINSVLTDTPVYYEDGLTRAECFSARNVQEVADLLHDLRPGVGHLMGKIWHMEATEPHLIDDLLIDTSNTKDDGSDCLGNNRKHLPFYHYFKKNLNHGILPSDDLAIIAAWFKYLLYLPGKENVTVEEMSHQALTCDTQATIASCADCSEKDSEATWRAYLLVRGYNYQPFLDDPYAQAFELEDQRKSGALVDEHSDVDDSGSEYSIRLHDSANDSEEDFGECCTDGSAESSENGPLGASASEHTHHTNNKQTERIDNQSLGHFNENIELKNHPVGTACITAQYSISKRFGDHDIAPSTPQPDTLSSIARARPIDFELSISDGKNEGGSVHKRLGNSAKRQTGIKSLFSGVCRSFIPRGRRQSASGPYTKAQSSSAVGVTEPIIEAVDASSRMTSSLEKQDSSSLASSRKRKATTTIEELTTVVMGAPRRLKKMFRRVTSSQEPDVNIKAVRPQPASEGLNLSVEHYKLKQEHMALDKHEKELGRAHELHKQIVSVKKVDVALTEQNIKQQRLKFRQEILDQDVVSDDVSELTDDGGDSVMTDLEEEADERSFFDAPEEVIKPMPKMRIPRKPIYRQPSIEDPEMDVLEPQITVIHKPLPQQITDYRQGEDTAEPGRSTDKEKAEDEEMSDYERSNDYAPPSPVDSAYASAFSKPSNSTRTLSWSSLASFVRGRAPDEKKTVKMRAREEKHQKKRDAKSAKRVEKAEKKAKKAREKKVKVGFLEKFKLTEKAYWGASLRQAGEMGLFY